MTDEWFEMLTPAERRRWFRVLRLMGPVKRRLDALQREQWRLIQLGADRLERREKSRRKG